MKKVTAKSAMKKFVGISAMALMMGTGMNFVSCSSDDDDGGDEQQEVQVDDEGGQQSEDEKEKEKKEEVDDTKTVSSITATESAEVYEGASEDDLRSKLTVTAIYDDESTAAVTGYTISGFDGSKTGEQEVTVTYKEKTATVKVTVKAEVLFTSLTFDAAFDGTTEKEYAKADADFVSEDGTWKIIKGVSVAKVVAASATSYNEDTTYTSRIQIKGEALKLKVGKSKSVILRVDGGSASGTGSNRTITAKGADTATWQSFKGAADGKVCAGFLEVTGDANGYVTLSANDNINIYGIKVVEAKEDLSTVVLGSTFDYNDTKVELSATEVNLKDTVTASASTSATKKPLYANGLVGEAGEAETLTTFNFYVDDGTEPVEKLPTDDKGEHTVKAVFYTLAEDGTTKTENSKVTAEATYKVVDPNAIKHTVTFEAGEGSFAEGATTSFQIEDGTTITTSDIPKPTAPEGKRFKEWTSSVEGLKTDSEITADVTFTATYEVGFTELFETITSGNTFPSAKNSSTTVTFSSGVSVVSGKGTGTKLEDKVVTIDGITSAKRLSLDKAANEASIKIPVSGKSVVKIGFNPSKVARGLTLSSDNELTVNEGEASTSVDYVTTAETAENELVTVTASSDITLKVKDPASSAGSVYIYFIDVTASE